MIKNKLAEIHELSELDDLDEVDEVQVQRKKRLVYIHEWGKGIPNEVQGG